MSFFYPSPAAVARSRRAKDVARSNAATSTTRRHKDPSKPHDEKSTPSSSPPASHAEPVADPAGTEATSPTSAPPGAHGLHQFSAGSAAMYQMPNEPITPTALQQYLDDGGDMNGPDGAQDDPATVLTQSVPDLKAAHPTGEPSAQEDAKSVQSEPADLPQEKTSHPPARPTTKSESPTSFSSFMSHSGQTEITHERSYTPPPPPLTATQSYSPPPYMSPVPVRAQPFSQHFLPYQAPTAYPFHHAGFPLENSSTPHMPSHFYPEYAAARVHYPSSGPMQRTHTQETASSAHRKHHRRSMSHVGSDEDVPALLTRINSVLPDFQALLDRYDEASGHLSGDPKSRRQSKTQIEESLKEKDAQISKLRRDIDLAAESFQIERKELQAELSKARAACQELESSVLARTRSRDNLRERTEWLQKSHDELAGRSSNIEMALESLRVWTIRDLEAKHKPPVLSTSSTAVEKPEAAAAREKALPTLEASLPGRYTESRGPSPSPLEVQTQPSYDLAGAMALMRSEADEAQLQKLQASQALAMETQAAERREQHLREIFQREREAQAETAEDERAEMKRHWEARHQALLDKHEQEKGDLQRLVETSQSRHQQRYHELEADNRDLRHQLGQLRAQLTSEQLRWSQSMADVKSAAVRVDKDCRNLRHLLDTYDTTPTSRPMIEGDPHRNQHATPGLMPQLD